ncbi:hypothetical protein BRADI_3g19296v3 [Brachypodium distachyon]|uniref:Uncharacterized protein n=1 Tax=Brachypodium distachyon TaxID=15368 RepID=A0A2K2CY83_BRADI|nr:hypothetical protein BRADI_3g19296v3 [Brachypodium distachyon]
MDEGIPAQHASHSCVMSKQKQLRICCRQRKRPRKMEGRVRAAICGFTHGALDDHGDLRRHSTTAPDLAHAQCELRRQC